ncbi:MAG: tetratricopeptide repeat protein, partial [Pyrinomonadaceae bacterium]
SKNNSPLEPATIGQGKIESPTKRPNTEESPVSKQEAAEFLKIKAQLSQLLAQAYHNLGVIAAQRGLLEEAMTRFAAAADWKPDFPGLDRNWGITGFRAEQFEKAIPPLARHVKIHPEDALTRRMLGVSYYLTRNYKQSLETLKPLETSLSTDPELAYFYGISLIRLDKQPQATVLFTRLSEQNPKSAQARFYAAQGFALVGDYERALKEFRSVAAVDSSFAQAHYSAGQSLIRLNRLDEAEKEFRQELGLNSADAAAKYYLAYTLLERKIQTDEALSLLKEAIALRYDYADARYQLGKALIEKGELEDAVEQLETAARFEPKKEYIHYQLSIAYRRAARPIDADRELKLYRELKSANRAEATPGIMGAKENVP